VAVLLAAACLAASAQEARPTSLLSLTPPEARLLLRVRDTPRLLERTEALLAALRPEAVGPDPDAPRLAADARALAVGAALAAWSEKEGWFFAIETKASRAELVARLREYGALSEWRDAWTLRLPRSRTVLHAALRDGTLALASDAARVRGFLGAAVPSGTLKWTATPYAEWMASPAAQGADLALYQVSGAAESLLADAFATPPQRRLAAAFGLGAAARAPAALFLRVEEEGLRADVLAALPKAAGVRRATITLPPGMDGFRLAVAGFNPAQVIEGIGRAQTRFDPDAGREFAEELTELNRDLGFDLAQDLLARLGDWTFSISPKEEGTPDWAVTARLDAREAFLARAQRLAEFAETGWAEAPERADARRFTSRAFNMPLFLAARSDHVVLASSPEVEERLIAWTPSAGAPQPPEDALWRIEAQLDLDRLGPLAIQCLPFKRLPPWLGAFPPGSRAILSVRRTETALVARAQLTGLSPRQLAAVFVRAAPAPRPPKWVLEQPVEKIDVKTREIVVRKIAEWQALGPNPEGLYRNPRTREFTMTSAMTCAACGQKIPTPPMPPEAAGGGPAAHEAWMRTARCPLCGRTPFIVRQENP